MNTETIIAFSNIAETYDESVSSNSILQWMREAVHGIYLRYLNPGDRILELNCGTGIDALFLARNGMNVTATDASPKMIEIVRRKINTPLAPLKAGIEATDLKGEIRAEICSFSEIHRLEESNFDAVVSNFGGLNCINDFTELRRQLSLKLKPNGIFIAVVMNKICPWEITYYLMKLDARNAFRRFSKNGLDVKIHPPGPLPPRSPFGKKGRPGIDVRTYYYTPGAFAKSFAKNFSAEKIYALALFTPPPYLEALWRKFGKAGRMMLKRDHALYGSLPFNRFGDHFIAVMRKKM
jgi:ubiquinone/menaquinone biosynthesis C-methylase UbiE